MPSPLPILLLLLLLSTITSATLRGSIQINCGATTRLTISNRLWLPDAEFTSSGTAKTLTLPSLAPTLSTLRSFPYTPSSGPRKFCYDIPIYTVSAEKFLLRTTFFHGISSSPPPVFDQIVDGTFWTVVNTTEDVERGMASYYEMVYRPKGRKSTSVCVAGNVYTDGDPFISGIEMVILPNSTYNSTDFEKNALGLVARSDFGSTGSVLRYPDDPYDRFWQPFIDSSNSIKNSDNISISGFWNLPPSRIFERSLVSENNKPLDLKWPPISLRNSTYYIALYFLDPSPQNSMRQFNISINGVDLYTSLSVTSSGVSVFSANWILSGFTNIKMVPSSSSSLPPIINGGEVYGVMNVGEITTTQDVTALLEIKEQIENPPTGWEGDPCLPQGYSWAGITCSLGSRIRVTSLNLTNMGLSGTLSPSISNLTALTDVLLGSNNFSGSIPDLRQLKQLEFLHLQDNQFSGELPTELGELNSLQELFVQNNNLTGEVPSSLLNKPGLILRTSPGNNFS